MLCASTSMPGWAMRRIRSSAMTSDAGASVSPISAMASGTPQCACTSTVFTRRPLTTTSRRRGACARAAGSPSHPMNAMPVSAAALLTNSLRVVMRFPRVSHNPLPPVAAEPEHRGTQAFRRNAARAHHFPDREANLRKELRRVPQLVAVAREKALPQPRKPDRDDRNRRAREDPHDAAPEFGHLAVLSQPALGEQADQLARLKLAGDRVIGVLEHLLIRLCGSDSNSAHRAEEEAQHRNPENPIVHDPADRPPAGGGDDQGVDEGNVVAGDDRRPLLGNTRKARFAQPV